MQLIRSRWPWEYELREGERVVAGIHVGFWRDQGALVVGGVTHRVLLMEFLGRRFAVAPSDHPPARAEREGLLRFSYRVEAGGRHWLVRSQGPFRRGVTVFSATAVDRVVGEVRPEGWFHQRAAVRLPADMPPLAQAFVCWLAVLHWKRRASRS